MDTENLRKFKANNYKLWYDLNDGDIVKCVYKKTDVEYRFQFVENPMSHESWSKKYHGPEAEYVPYTFFNLAERYGKGSCIQRMEKWFYFIEVENENI